MIRHTGPIFSLKWNQKGDLFLTGSVDKTAIIWDSNTGEARQQYSFHTGPVLEVDWKDDTTFATCSTDRQIFVCQLGSPEPIIQFSGHEVCIYKLIIIIIFIYFIIFFCIKLYLCI